MKKSITVFLFILLGTTGVFSQNYEQAAGFRLGAASGLTYRRFLANDISGELMLLTQNHGKVLAFLVQKHKPALLFDDLNLNFIYGIGAHIGFADRYRYNDADLNDFNYHRHTITRFQLGIDAFAAFEYELPGYPVIISLESKPYFEVFDDRLIGIHMPVIAFGARYIF